MGSAVLELRADHVGKVAHAAQFAHLVQGNIDFELVLDIHYDVHRRHGIDIEIVAQKKAGYPGVHHLGRIPTDVVPRLAKELKEEHPEIDTIKIVCAHWASVEAIDNIEQELGVGAVSNSLGITWYALRQAGITDSIPGKGRLLREF